MYTGMIAYRILFYNFEAVRPREKAGALTICCTVKERLRQANKDNTRGCVRRAGQCDRALCSVAQRKDIARAEIRYEIAGEGVAVHGTACG